MLPIKTKGDLIHSFQKRFCIIIQIPTVHAPSNHIFFHDL